MIRLFRVFIPIGTLALLVSETVLVACSFILAAYIVLDSLWVFLYLEAGVWRILFVTISVITGLYFHDLYSAIHVKSRILLLQQLSLTMGLAFVVMGALSYVNRDLRLSLHVMVVGSGISIAAIFIWRMLFANYLVGVVGAQRVLFVGCNSLVQAIARQLTEHPELGLGIVGYVDDDAPPGTERIGGSVLGGIAKLRDVAARVSPTRIIVGMSERRNAMPVTDLLELRFAGIIIEEASSSYESVCMRISTLELRPAQLVFSGELGPRRGILLLQAIYNLVLALIGTIVSLPFMLIAALGVRLSSAGPVLYRQTRVGMDGVLFTVYKFRSMYKDAEATTGAVWATKDDPRVTPFGRFLRKSRLDELPQWFNVLRGDMAIVGPRPERPEFVKILSERIPYYRQRHCVKPGITGWAQVNHKYGDSLEDSITKLEYDLYYIKNVSLTLDIYIIFHTLKTIILSRGSQ